MGSLIHVCHLPPSWPEGGGGRRRREGGRDGWREMKVGRGKGRDREGEGGREGR